MEESTKHAGRTPPANVARLRPMPRVCKDDQLVAHLPAIRVILLTVDLANASLPVKCAQPGGNGRSRPSTHLSI